MEQLFPHHATLLQGDQGTLKEVCASLARAGVGTSENPDVSVHTFDTLGIDEVREIIMRASMRALMPTGKWFIVFFLSATREAQNALLKTLEEPSANTHFILITENTSRIIPTLLSRLEVKGGDEAASSVEAEHFLKHSTPKRLAMLASIIKEKDRGAAALFLRALEGAAKKQELFKKDPEFVHDLIRFRDYLGDRGSSVKMVLEYIAHTAPRS